MGLKTLCKGACFGATAMYFFDPERGPYRRALFTDKMRSLTNGICDAFDVAARDFNNRLTGMTAEMRSLRSINEPVPDDVLCERIRSKLGRYISHPRAIQVNVADGRVRLSGPILTSEVERLIDVVRGLAGVNQVENNLDPHQSAENIPALQGGRPKMGEPIDLMQENWSPTTKFMLGVAGAAFLLTGSMRAACLATGLGAVGLGMVGNGASFSGFVNRLGGDGQRGSESTSGRAMGDAMAQHAMPSSTRTSEQGQSRPTGEGSTTTGFNTMQQPSMAANPTESGIRGQL
jgi:BON domain-containing protein